MKTHRCKGSLQNKVSIKYSVKYRNCITDDDYEAWRLFENKEDLEYDTYYQLHIAEIKYCPFCGEELKGDTNND